MLITTSVFSANLNEQLAAQKHINYLYQSRTGRIFRFFITNKYAARFAGWYTRTRFSRIHISSFINNHQIDITESEEKIDAYRSFNDFFTRKLKQSARPINQESNSIISPADGYIIIVNDLKEHTPIMIKNVPFTLATFLANTNAAQKFYNGTMVIIYLAPWNYHRFHFPFKASATKTHSIHGTYESVHPFVFFSSTQPLHVNERICWHLIADNNNNNEIMCVAVGATFVGQITTSFTPNIIYQKGDEMGYFSFGGSTVVLIFPKDTFIPDTKEDSWKEIKMGQKIGSWKNQS